MLVHTGVPTDRYVVDEARAYRPLELRPDDVVLDLGACIGSYTVIAARTARKVIAVEPAPENFELLAMNCADLTDRTQLIQAAVVGDRRGSVRLFTASSWNHSTVAYRGRTASVEVPAVCFADLLETERPTVLKADIEGAEWDLPITDLPDYVRAFAIELHQTRAEWRAKTPDVLQAWRDAGFTLLATPSSSWQSLAIGVR